MMVVASRCRNDPHSHISPVCRRLSNRERKLVQPQVEYIWRQQQNKNDTTKRQVSGNKIFLSPLKFNVVLLNLLVFLNTGEVAVFLMPTFFSTFCKAKVKMFFTNIDLKRNFREQAGFGQETAVMFTIQTSQVALGFSGRSIPRGNGAPIQKALIDESIGAIGTVGGDHVFGHHAALKSREPNEPSKIVQGRCGHEFFLETA